MAQVCLFKSKCLCELCFSLSSPYKTIGALSRHFSHVCEERSSELALVLCLVYRLLWANSIPRCQVRSDRRFSLVVLWNQLVGRSLDCKNLI